VTKKNFMLKDLFLFLFYLTFCTACMKSEYFVSIDPCGRPSSSSCYYESDLCKDDCGREPPDCPGNEDETCYNLELSDCDKSGPDCEQDTNLDLSDDYGFYDVSEGSYYAASAQIEALTFAESLVSKSGNSLENEVLSPESASELEQALSATKSSNWFNDLLSPGASDSTGSSPDLTTGSSNLGGSDLSQRGSSTGSDELSDNNVSTGSSDATDEESTDGENTEENLNENAQYSAASNSGAKTQTRKSRRKKTSTSAPESAAAQNYDESNRAAVSGEKTLKIADPKNYFDLLLLDESIFKIVEKRYHKKKLRWHIDKTQKLLDKIK